MTFDEFLTQLQFQEEGAGLFDYELDGIHVYRLIRRSIVEDRLREMGFKVMNAQQGFDKKRSFLNVPASLWQLLKLCLLRRSASTVFISFPRVDKVGTHYLDKFVDPLVSLCLEDENDYLILDQGRGGVHLKPRLHQDHCLQTEWFVVSSRIYAKLFHKRFYRHNRACMDALYNAIDSVFGSCCPSKPVFSYSLCYVLRRIHKYEKLFRRLKVKRALGPSRDFVRTGIVAAHRIGIPFFELQHGITYGETVMYGGYHPEEMLPDLFLAFGNNDPIDVYGIEPQRIVNIGWAFNDYIASITDFIKYKESDVLVISDPEITDSVISATLMLAKANPDSHFYMRPHPHEELSQEQLERLTSVPNAHLQDRRINIAMVMQGFTHVVGENSTVLYEALAAGKKVGKLYFEGLRPRYLKEEDRDCFWEISDNNTFARFLKEDASCKKIKSIYSAFDKEKFLTITKIKL